MRFMKFLSISQWTLWDFCPSVESWMTQKISVHVIVLKVIKPVKISAKGRRLQKIAGFNWFAIESTRKILWHTIKSNRLLKIVEIP